MAEKRMFAKTIIDSDAFLDMPLSTQALYFHLSMRGDDDGFVNNPKRIMRTIGANENDYDVLVGKRFIIFFDTGVIVIKHWKMHNYIRKDRYKPTVYQDEKEMLATKENGSYTLDFDDDFDVGIPLVDQMTTNGQPRIDKISIDKNILSSNEPKKDETHIETYKEIINYLNSKAGTRYRHTSKATQRHINARLNEGYEIQDFKNVIDVKCNDWKNDKKMCQYLRPETLFGTKFESYLNQVETSASDNTFIQTSDGGFKLV